MIRSPPVEEGRVYTAPARRQREEKNRLQKHSGQMSTQHRTSSEETHIKRRGEGANRRLALSESAQNKQTFEFTNRGISSALTLAQPPVEDALWRFEKWGAETSPPRMVEKKQLAAHRAALVKPCVTEEQVCYRASDSSQEPPPLCEN